MHLEIVLHTALAASTHAVVSSDQNANVYAHPQNPGVKVSRNMCETTYMYTSHKEFSHSFMQTLSLYMHTHTSEALYHHGGDNLSLVVCEGLADPKQHEHVVTLRHAHCIQVTQHIGTCYLALWKRLL